MKKRYQGYSINKKTYINFLEDLYDIKPGAGYSKESFILPAIYQVRRPQTKIDAEIDKSYSVHTALKSDMVLFSKKSTIYNSYIGNN